VDLYAHRRETQAVRIAAGLGAAVGGTRGIRGRRRGSLFRAPGASWGRARPASGRVGSRTTVTRSTRSTGTTTTLSRRG